MVFAPVWPLKMAVLSCRVVAPRAARNYRPKLSLYGESHRTKLQSKVQIMKLGKLKARSEFLYVRDGAYSAKGGIVIQMRKHKTRHIGFKVGFTATKKIGNAVIRNRAKRRLREIARELLPEYGLAGYDYVFIARDNTTARKWSDLLDDARKALITLSKRAKDPNGVLDKKETAK